MVIIKKIIVSTMDTWLRKKISFHAPNRETLPITFFRLFRDYPSFVNIMAPESATTFWNRIFRCLFNCILHLHLYRIITTERLLFFSNQIYRLSLSEGRFILITKKLQIFVMQYFLLKASMIIFLALVTRIWMVYSILKYFFKYF